MAHFVAHLSWKDFYESPNTVDEEMYVSQR